jgi:hypothetical protein
MFEMVITPQLTDVPQRVKDRELARLFIGLTWAITDHDCYVDLTDPKNVRVTSKCH